MTQVSTDSWTALDLATAANLMQTHDPMLLWVLGNNPEAYPLYWRMLQYGRFVPTQNMGDGSFAWWYQQPHANETLLNGAVLVGDTDIVVDDESIFADDMLVRVNQGEVMRVTNVTTGTHTITVTRAVAGAAQAYDDDSTIYIIGWPFLESSDAPTPTHKASVKEYNLFEQFVDSIQLSNAMLRNYNDVLTMKEAAKQQALLLQRMVERFEESILFSERVATNGTLPQTTRGLWWSMAEGDNITDASGVDLSLDILNEMLQEAYDDTRLNPPITALYMSEHQFEVFNTLDATLRRAEYSRDAVGYRVVSWQPTKSARTIPVVMVPRLPADVVMAVPEGEIQIYQVPPVWTPLGVQGTYRKWMIETWFGVKAKGIQFAGCALEGLSTS